MRIVGGAWAGRDLASPAGRVRPTAEAVRVALMDLLGTDTLKDARVVDLFAGTGAVGLEALSRGAARCDFVENNPRAIHALKANIAAMRARDRTRVFDRDAVQFADRLGPASYDIAFADPPYGSRKLDRILQRWRAVPFSDILALEHSVDVRPPGQGRSRRIDDSVLTLFRAPSVRQKSTQ